MQVDAISSISEARAIDLSHRTVIVIDVLRATSTIVTALAYGAAGVIPVETVGQAKHCFVPGDILGGERYCKKIIGFDAGNSPLEYTNDDFRGRRIVLTTTNGTRAIQKAVRAEHIIAGAFLNAQLCAQVAVKLKRDVALLCAGSQDTFAFEDGLCAGLLLHEISRIKEETQDAIVMNDLGSMVMSAYLHHADNLLSALQQCASAKRLAKLGYHKDVEFCSAVNTIPVVPRMVHQMMIPFTGFTS
ncbi:2-phosphosulfolactate phosphatase [Paenibacillus sp. UMB4589-SE434]|uniref:2-phosphosulfolactate phosphatase n=1 Tax=Paenibacillus sp. UMB4589-SE434 TaxID=3046314 RepID=UPI00254B0F8D|nr:2-phosphosulfolactate phosphatase [Paenibacillus sp. UMB4589-SE434]MDK8179328.1 2-phosphosulfolactate phosphatase [Paenibacillus sp. UMB4589-SE434]